MINYILDIYFNDEFLDNMDLCEFSLLANIKKYFAKIYKNNIDTYLNIIINIKEINLIVCDDKYFKININNIFDINFTNELFDIICRD